jgi:phosphatidylglycerol---prolipoprotein diacylglyceryl transferase
MLPYLFTIGSYSQSTYGVLVALAFVAAVTLTGRLARRVGLPQEAVMNLGMYCAIAGIVGAKVLMLLVDLPQYLANPRDIFSLATLRAGGDFFGGLILALLTAWYYMRKKGLPGLRTADVFAPGLALGHAIGRLGCFAAGCCWGVPAHLPWAVTFTKPEAHELGVPLNIPLHPTQLYEAVAETVIFAILYRRFRKPHQPGAIISLYMMLYGTTRFLVEFVRNHEQGNLWGGPFDTSQWISLALVALAIAWQVRARKRQPATSAPAAI